MGWFLRKRRQEAKVLDRAWRRVPLTVRAIALVQAAKGLLFLLAGLLTARVARLPDLEGWLMEVLVRWHFDPDGERAQRLLSWGLGLSHQRLRLIAAGLFAYAAIYLIEGVGLWFDRPWAEWLVVLATGIFIPLEAEHLCCKPSWGIACMLVLNCVVVAFLAWRIRQRRPASPRPT